MTGTSHVNVLRVMKPPCRAAQKQWALWCPAGLYLFLIYCRPALEYILPPQITIYSNIVALSSAALALVLYPTGQASMRAHGHLLFLAAGAIVIGASAVVNGSRADQTLVLLYNFVGTWLTFTVFSAVYRTSSGARALTTVLVALAIFNSAVGLWGLATKGTLFNVASQEVGVGAFGYDSTSGRVGGIIGENYVGLANVPALVAGLFIVYRPKWRLAGIAVIALASGAIVVSLSRTSLISGLVGAGVFYLLHIKAKRSTLLVVILFGIVAYAGVDYIRNWHVEGEYREISSDYRWSVEGFQESRFHLWQRYFVDAIQSPLFGRGPGYIQDQISTGMEMPHNSFLDIFVELGMPGLLIYSAAFLTIFRNFRRARARSGKLFATILFACACGMTVSIITLSNPLVRQLWIVAGALDGLQWWPVFPAMKRVIGQCRYVPCGTEQ